MYTIKTKEKRLDDDLMNVGVTKGYGPIQSPAGGPTVFSLGEYGAVLRAAVQNHPWSKQVRAALQFDAGFPAELCNAVRSAHYLHSGPVALPFVPDHQIRRFS